MKSNVISLKSRMPLEPVEVKIEEKLQEMKAVSEDTTKSEVIVKPVKTKKSNKVVQTKNYNKVISNSLKLIGLGCMISGVTAYLVYQNYEFFTAIITSNHNVTVMGVEVSIPAFLNSIIAEIILLTSAAYTSSKKLMTKILAWVLMVGMIAGLGTFMHASIDNDIVGNSDYVLNLKQQKTDALKAKDSYEAEKDALDALKWKSRREALQKKIDAERASIATIDAKLAEAKNVSNENQKAIVIYNSILRIAAMLINALLAHTLICRIKD